MRRLTYKTLAAAPFLSVIVPLTTAAEPASPASLASEASGADFHVAPDGDDRNPGTLEKPFATLGRARDAVRAMKTAGPIDGVSLLPLIEGKMQRRPKPMPFLAGNQSRLIDNEYTLATGRLFRFAEGGRNDVDITDQEPEVLKRMTDWLNEWRASVKKDGAAYADKRK